MDDTAAVQPSLADFETRTFGGATLVHGDCLKVMPLLASNSVTMCFADLPYGITRLQWDQNLPMREMWHLVDRAVSPQGAKIFTASPVFGAALITANPKKFRYDLIWFKSRASTFFLAKKQPMRSHESILVFSNLPHIYNPQMRTDTLGQPGGSHTGLGSPHFSKTNRVACKRGGPLYPISVLKPAYPNYERGKHPTQKPVALLEWLIRTYTNDGDTILDPVAGSATTAIAALNVGNRKVICIEKDPIYFEIMNKRVSEHHVKMEAARGTI